MLKTVDNLLMSKGQKTFSSVVYAIKILFHF